MVDSRSLLTLALAMACIAAFGVAGSTFQSSVTTNPDEAIDVDSERLPIGSDGARDIREAVKPGEGEETGDAGSGDGGDGSSQSSQPDDSGTPEGGGGDGSGQEQGAGPGQGEGTGPADPSLLDSLLPYLLALLALLLALLVAAILYRYRDRIRALLAVLFGGFLPDDDRSAVYGRIEPWGAIEPTNPVFRAWLRLVHTLDVDRPETMTAEECERAAVAAGMDEHAVDSLADAFREARYSGRPVTDDLCDRAEQSADRLGLGGDRRTTTRSHGGTA